MAIEVLVPPLGQTVDTLTLASWYKREGEAVTQGEPLFAVETDKATLDVEAPASGVVGRVTAAVGDEVKVLSAIAVIIAPGERLEEEKGRSDEPQGGRLFRHAPTTPLLDRPVAAHQRRFISPRARRLAESENVPLTAVTATGPEGAIIERDVQAYLQEAWSTGHKGRAAGEMLETKRTITPVARRMAEDAGLDLEALVGTGPRGQIAREDVVRAPL